MTTALFTIGLLAVIAGAFLWTVPAGIVTAGLSACVAAVLVERATGDA